MLSDVVRESTVNLILTVSGPGSVYWSFIDIILSNWNVGALLNFLLIQTRQRMNATMDIWKAGVTMMNHPLEWMTGKATKRKVKKTTTTLQKISNTSMPSLKQVMKSLRETSTITR